MHRHNAMLALLLAAILTSCSQQPATVTSIATFVPTQFSRSIFTQTPPSTSAPTLILIATPNPTSLSTEDWSTFTHGVERGAVSLEYPTNWQITPGLHDQDYGYFFFDFAPPLEQGLNRSIILSIYQHRDASFVSRANPYNWQPNEGGYEVQWADPISLDDLTCLEFVWATEDWDPMTSLNIICYSETDFLEVRLMTYFGQEQLAAIETLGISETVSSKFAIFDHMAESVRITK